MASKVKADKKREIVKDTKKYLYKTINLKVDVYEKLQTLGGFGETASALILRLINNQQK